MFEPVYISKYGRKFKSKNLNRAKYAEIFEVANEMREFRNKLSEYTWANFDELIIKRSSTEFLTFIRNNYEPARHLDSNFDYDQITAVYAAYEGRRKAIIKNIAFNVHIFEGFAYYKNNTKWHKKGDFRSVKFIDKKTPLTIALTYIARYWRESEDEMRDYISKQFADENKTLSDDKRKFYENILRCVDKFSYERLYRLASSKRDRVFDRYRKRNAVHFEKLTFGARSRKANFIQFNTNKDSLIDAFIELSWKTRTLFIPVSYSKAFFGDIGKFNEKKSNFQYEITFDEKKKEIFVHMSVDGERKNFDARNLKDFIAGDRNSKHDMFMLSSPVVCGTDDNGNPIHTREFDYDRELIDAYEKHLKDIENKKKNDPNYTYGKRVRIREKTLNEKMKQSMFRITAEMFEAVKRSGHNHFVGEELNGTYGKCYVKDKNGVNYNKILGFLNFFSYDDFLERIAHKHGVAVSFVHAAYTSQTCPVCGNIHEGNRPTQEKFKCTECGYETNADENSSVNILNRVCIDVLCNRLLKLSDNGEFRPKKTKR